MRKKLLLLSALTCMAGAPALLAPASAQSAIPPCEDLVGTACTGGFTECRAYWGGPETLYCYEGTWYTGW
ncbi:MAG TPA: hypothetical protein VF615_05785 [Longimicrobiaceae bacterium]|jgi:hypothetical protein